MRKSVVSTLFVLALVFSAAPASAASDLDDLKATFRVAVDALNSRNLDGFLATIHPKSLSFYSCGPTSGKEGREACESDWKKFFTYTANARFNTDGVEARIVGNTGIVWGKYSAAVKNRDGKEKLHTGRYSLIYTKVDGKWMIVWQENSPAPAPASTPTS